MQLATFLARHGTFCKQLDDVVGQAGIKQFLKRPGELRTLEITFRKCDAVCGGEDVWNLRLDAEFHVVSLCGGAELKIRMFVFGDFLNHCFERSHPGYPS